MRHSIAGLTIAAMLGLSGAAFAQDADVASRDRVLRDPEIPALGNEKGDVTIVEWFDYQCPYCKKFAPDLAKLAKDDKHLRVVLKDWPILGDPSPYAAKLVLASKYQGKYEAAHDALMAHVGRLTEAVIDETLAQADVDVDAAKRDLEAHKSEIEALLVRNSNQAEALGFNSTPSFIVGTFRIPGVMSPELFKRAIADARAAAKKTGTKKDDTKKDSASAKPK